MLGNVFYAFTQFILLIILAKLGNPTVVGQFTLALAVCSPVFLLSNLKLRTVMCTDINDNYYYKTFKFLRVLSSLIAIIFIALIAFFSNYSLDMFWVIMLFSFAKFVEMQSDIYYGLFQKREEMDLIAKSLIIKGTLNILFVYGLYVYTSNLIFVVLGIFISNLLVLIFFDKRNSVRFNSDWSIPIKDILIKKQLINLLIISFPLGLSTALGSLNTNMPRYFVEQNLGQYELGIFAAISYLLIAANTIINALSQAVTPRLAKLFLNNIDQFIKFTTKLILLGFSIGLLSLIIVFFFGEEILLIIYSEDYANYSSVLLVITLGSLVLLTSVFLGTAISASRNYKIQPKIQVVTTFFILVGSYFFINKLGLIGAAWAVFTGYLTTSIGYLIAFIVIVYKAKWVDENK